MKKLLLNLFFGLLVITAFSQTPVYTLDFETPGGYTTTSDEAIGSADSDYFTRTDGSNINQYAEFTNIQGSYFFAVQDADGAGVTFPAEINITGIDITGITSLGFSIMIAEDQAYDNAEDWDADSYIHIQYQIGSGGFQDLLWIEAEGGTNTVPKVDTDFDGLGDGTEITPAFQALTASIAGTGTTLDIKIIINGLDAGDEDVAFDNIQIFEPDVDAPVATFEEDGATDVFPHQNLTISLDEAILETNADEIRRRS